MRGCSPRFWVKEMQPERRWYVVQTYSGYEKRVEADLRQRIATMNMEDKIFDVLVPIENRIVVKDGKSREVPRKLFPSYVLVEMIMDEELWYAVRHTPGVTGFIGAGTHPMPLSQEEVDRLMSKVKKDDDLEVELDFEPGDIVRVTSGALKGRTGPVVEVNPKKGKVKFRVDAFGGESITEADYQFLEKI